MRRNTRISRITTYVERAPMSENQALGLNTEFIFDHSRQRRVLPTMSPTASKTNRLQTMNRSGKPVR